MKPINNDNKSPIGYCCELHTHATLWGFRVACAYQLWITNHFDELAELQMVVLDPAVINPESLVGVMTPGGKTSQRRKTEGRQTFGKM